MIVRDIVAAVLLLGGAGFAVLGCLGLLRFPDMLTRLHAATKPQVLGLLLILAGVGTHLGDAAAATQVVLVALFQLATVPVTAQTIGRVARDLGEIRVDRLVRDDRWDIGSEDGPS